MIDPIFASTSSLSSRSWEMLIDVFSISRLERIVVCLIGIRSPVTQHDHVVEEEMLSRKSRDYSRYKMADLWQEIIYLFEDM